MNTQTAVFAGGCFWCTEVTDSLVETKNSGSEV